MHTAVMQFTHDREVASDDRDSAIQTLLGVLRMNGQILGSEFPTALTGDGYQAFVSIPEKTSLSRRHANQYVKHALDRIAALGLELRVSVLGHDPESAPVCRCRDRSWSVLFTNYVCIDPPLRCGACFGALPLYRFPPTSNDAFDDVICWESDYRACDRLQMNCAVGERFATAQLSRVSSGLSSRGRAVCARFSELAGYPVYYYLYRGSGRSLRAEKNRVCPSCNSPWLVEPPLCRFFDMKCDSCRLVSNIAWNVRH
jgi:predicted  nucleic acid-binding Zn ribbon protein